MWFIQLGAAQWKDTQAAVCALVKLGREGAVLSYHQSPCLCMGSQVDVDQRVDWDYIHTHEIPVFRRNARADVTCCAPVQLELQIVLPRNHRWLAAGAPRLRAVLSPLLETCRDLKLEASYKAPNEIIVGGRRIGSACLSEVNSHIVLAASLSLEFDAELLAHALHVQSPEVRERLTGLLRSHRTSLHEELGAPPTYETLEPMVRSHLRSIAGTLETGEMDPALCARMNEEGAALFAPSRWAAQQVTNGWQFDLGAGAALQQCAYKAPGGFLRALCEWQDGRIAQASLSGDFFCYPPGGLYRLEAALVGVRADQVAAKIDDFYRELGLVTPGIRAAHWAKVLVPMPAAS